MFKKLIYLISIVTLLIATSTVQAQVVISTAAGNGADTCLENDGQSGNHGPDSVHGSDTSIPIRNYEGVRQKFGYIRFDITGLSGDLSGATLSITVNISNRNRNWLIYGLVDESLDNWDEATTSYSNAPGILPAALGSFALDDTKLQLIGFLSVQENAPTRDTPNTYTSNINDLNLDSFLKSDTNKLVTFVVINENSDSNASYWVATKEGDPAMAPALTFPNASLGLAMNPNPANQAVDVPHDGLILSWTPGETAISHDVYFGDDADTVGNADRTNPMGVLLAQGQEANTFALDHLNFNQTYYWRIDEVGGTPGPIYAGQVWSFTTEPVSYSVPSENITATASSSEEGKGPENTINGSGLDETGLLHGIVGSENMWLSNKDGAQPSWIEYEFDRLYKLHEMWVWNSNEGLEPSIGIGIKEVKIEYSADGIDYKTLGTTHEFAQAPGTVDYAHNTNIDFGGAVAKYVRLTANSNWGGILTQYGLSEVRFFYIPVSAREPYPESNATDVDVDVILAWRAGREAASHDVYVSADPNAMSLAGSVTESSFDTASLALIMGQTYHWRVDEVNDAETPAKWQGETWSFSTQEFIVVDDFEAYNEIPSGEPDSRLIYETWSDGVANPTTNGSTIGYFVPFEPTMETETVHSGDQSVPLTYNNSVASLSEVTVNPADLPIGRDWTKGSSQTLALWFHGNPGNAITEQMYLKIGGSKVLYDGDAIALSRPQWTQWNVDLTNLGANPRNVTTFAIGLERTGSVGGSGTIFIDDIRLYYQAPPLPLETVWVEAETGTVTPPMRLFDDPTASGGQYVSTEPGTGDQGSAPPYPDGTVSIPFTVGGGTYTLRFRIGFPGGDDSCWLRIQDATTQSPVHSSGWVHFNDMPTGDFWHWSQEVKSEDEPGEPPVEFTMAAGTHTLEIAYRGADLRIDAVVFSKID